MRILLTVLLTFSVNTYAYIYGTNGLTTDNPDQLMRDHVCLSLVVFLESRGESDTSQMFHGMATLQRVLNPSRWSNTVCDVIMERSQYEPIKQRERNVINAFLAGDGNAIDKYIERYYNHKPELDAWFNINEITYNLITAPDTEGWIKADHFYSPKSLHKRSMQVPAWIEQKSIVMVSDSTVFLF